ncbi:hypothetical protein F5884DRAFT_899840 [Xylogone sp. PMI_703]|nr:hypothetical protein F5884DRAFT_899840 [Xylogone sp. PMI_703]
MRLLEHMPSGDLVLREFVGKDIPAYAILSHTWDKEEVSFQELEAGTGKDKAGWKKIEFCAKQAWADGLRYIWLDTCCIDKRNAVELSEAINSMFHWYQKAARCYAYLLDVSTDGQDDQTNPSWTTAFRESRWFTRGWTLQELIAPTLVDFFSSEGERLGNKLTLEHMIHGITGIATSALRGDALSNFSIDERMSWAEHRNTTLEEDKYYCLLGIFDVSMPLIYGERGDKAFRRLQEEIHKSYKGPDFEQFTVKLNLSTFPESAEFVARASELTEMHRLLHGHKTRSAVVLQGLGGIGKTQLAIQYVKKYKEKYTAIFWLNANDRDSLRLSFKDMAQQILEHHASTSILVGANLEGNPDQMVNAVKAWLNTHKNTRWLLIYDNYDNPRSANNSDPSTVDIRPYIPGADHGSIIITTRSANVTQGRRLHIQKLTSIEEGLKILSNTSGRKGIESDPNAIALATKLDGLPLALSTAGAYLEHMTTSFSEYLRLYEESWLKLQMTSPQVNSYEDRSLYTTWQITFDRIRQQNAASAQLLKLWAYFDKQDVWFELLRPKNFVDDELIRKLTEDELSFNEAVRLLCEYGLVHKEASLQQPSRSEGYGVHSCVHSWTIFVLNRECDESLVKLALRCVASKVTSTDVDKWWVVQRRILQHAARCEHLIMDGKVDIAGMEWALNNLGLLYSNQGKLAEAEKMYIRALQGYEKALGPDHISTLNTVNNLGSLYHNQDKLAEAKKMYIRALQGYEKALGPDHISTLNMVNNLGILYCNQGKLAEAEKMYVRALHGKEKAFGPDHTSTLNTVNNLGILYHNQDKLAEAKKMYIRALQGYEKAFGPDHTSTLDIVNNLGSLYRNQSKLAEAEKMYIRALQGYEKAFGPDHTSTLDIVNNLGSLYRNQSKLAEAEKMYIRALQGYEKAFGPDHTSTLDIVNNLGNLYRNQGKLAEAEKMYIRALQGKEKIFGPDHTSTLDTVNNLGILYRNQSKLAEAEKMYVRALQGKEKAFGPDHTSTLDIVNNLGNLYRNQGKLAEAEKMYIRALQGYEDALTPELASSYIPALNTMFAFGDLFSRTDRKDKAKAMYNRALSGYRTVQGPSSKWCSEIESRLAGLQLTQAETGTTETFP